MVTNIAAEVFALAQDDFVNIELGLQTFHGLLKYDFIRLAPATGTLIGPLISI
jgi:hypothetical protein